MSAPDPTEAALRAAVGRFIDSYGEDGDFGDLALRLWRWQRDHNPGYRALAADAEPASWVQIPAAPVRLFRALPLTSFPPDEARVVFRTSGTTGGRGVVRLRDTALYDRGARLHAERVVGPIPAQGAGLVSPAPDSSLGHMCQAFCPGLQGFFSLDEGVNADGLLAWLRAAEGPVFVPGTAFAFAALLDADPAPVALAPGSIVMVTGGFKGRRVSVEEGALLDRLRALLPGASLVGEYGMSELGSQLWSRRLGEPFAPPPWLRAVAVEPGTGAPSDRGLLRFVDLANLDTVVAIETGDLGEVLDDGSVRLLGRHPGAPLRGCSLTVEEALRPAPPAESGPPPTRAALATRASGWFDRDPAAEAGRVDSVLRALTRLRRRDAEALAEGLSGPTATEGVGLACGALTREALLAELATPGLRPPDVVIVVAQGVFTSPLEWACLYAAAGIRVHLKAPAAAPAFCQALAADLSAEGLPVTASTDRALGDPAVVVAFGSDDGVAEVVAATPSSRHVTFGHRFSVVACAPEPWLAQGLAWDHALFDARGCMAPAAVFCVGDPAPLAEALVQALPMADLALPAGAPEPALGPERRRRVALARAVGSVEEAGDWRILTLSSDHFTPAALPRMVTLHPGPSPAAVVEALRPWRGALSSLGTDDRNRALADPHVREGVEQSAAHGSASARAALSAAPGWAALHQLFPRVVPIGALQRPRLGRRHDGRAMLGCVLEPPQP